MMRNILKSICLSVVLLSGCYDDFGGYSPEDTAHTAPNMTLGRLHEIYGHSEGSVVNGDVVVAGYVTANDRSDNFYKTFVIDDGTAALEVKAGVSYLFNTYAENRYVTVKAKGLTVGRSRYNGLMQIGLAPRGVSDDKVDYFGHEALLKKYIGCEDSDHSVAPLRVGIDELSQLTCGRLVTIGPLRLSSGQLWTWAVNPAESEYSSTSYRFFSDPNGDEIAVQTSNYASFAEGLIPDSELSLTGILMYGKAGSGSAVYMLKLRSLDDVEEI